MNFNRDITRFGWLIVGAVLAYGGLYAMVTREIYGKVRMPGSAPLVEGWLVFLIGVLEVIAGVLLVMWYFKKR